MKSKKKTIYEVYFFDEDDNLILGTEFYGTEDQTFTYAVDQANQIDEIENFVALDDDGELKLITFKTTEDRLWSQVFAYEECSELFAIIDDELIEESFFKALNLKDKIQITALRILWERSACFN